MFRFVRPTAVARAAASHTFHKTAATFPVRCLSFGPAKLGMAKLALRQPVKAGQLRAYSVLTQNSAKEYKYNEIKALTQAAGGKADVLLIDVREPAEFHEGHIPGAKNVPFKSSPGAFDLSEEEFEESFGFEKPAKDRELVFYCLGGVRSTAAEELANSFGYTKRGNYVGSWEDWVTQENAASKA